MFLALTDNEIIEALDVSRFDYSGNNLYPEFVPIKIDHADLQFRFSARGASTYRGWNCGQKHYLFDRQLLKIDKIKLVFKTHG